MQVRTTLALIMATALASAGGAAADAAKNRHRGHDVRHNRQIVASAPNDGPTLVMHPADNIACMTPYQSTRPLPCDQPVWVYGKPCEIDLGLGRHRSCE